MSDNNFLTGLVGLGFGILTLKVLSNLRPKIQSELNEILLKSTLKKRGERELLVHSYKLNRTIQLLKISGFKVLYESRVYPGIVKVTFEEKIKV